MFRKTRWIGVFAGVATFLAVIGSPAFALFPNLETGLWGSAVNGQVPQGDAKVDQSGLPYIPAHLEVMVKNVGLPDGTQLDVVLGHVSVGTITLTAGEGRLSTSLSIQVGRRDPIYVIDDAEAILTGGAPWEVS